MRRLTAIAVAAGMTATTLLCAACDGAPERSSRDAAQEDGQPDLDKGGGKNTGDRATAPETTGQKVLTGGAAVSFPIPGIAGLGIASLGIAGEPEAAGEASPSSPVRLSFTVTPLRLRATERFVLSVALTSAASGAEGSAEGQSTSTPAPSMPVGTIGLFAAQVGKPQNFTLSVPMEVRACLAGVRVAATHCPLKRPADGVTMRMMPLGASASGDGATPGLEEWATRLEIKDLTLSVR